MHGIRVMISARADTDGEVRFIELAMLGLVEALWADAEISAAFAPLYRQYSYECAKKAFSSQPWCQALEHPALQRLTPAFRATARQCIEQLFHQPVGWLEPLLGGCAILSPLAAVIPAELTIVCHHAPESRRLDGVFDALDDAMAMYQGVPTEIKRGRSPRPKEFEAYHRAGSCYVRHVLRQIPIHAIATEDSQDQYIIQHGIDRISDRLNLPQRPHRQAK
jgi:hypothetical protein